MSQNIIFNQLDQLKNENINVINNTVEKLLDMAPSDATLKGEFEDASNSKARQKANLKVYSQQLNVEVSALGDSKTDAFQRASRKMEVQLRDWLRHPSRLHRPDAHHI